MDAAEDNRGGSTGRGGCGRRVMPAEFGQSDTPPLSFPGAASTGFPARSLPRLRSWPSGKSRQWTGGVAAAGRRAVRCNALPATAGPAGSRRSSDSTWWPTPRGFWSHRAGRVSCLPCPDGDAPPVERGPEGGLVRGRRQERPGCHPGAGRTGAPPTRTAEANPGEGVDPQREESAVTRASVRNQGQAATRHRHDKGVSRCVAGWSPTMPMGASPGRIIEVTAELRFAGVHHEPPARHASRPGLRTRRGCPSHGAARDRAGRPSVRHRDEGSPPAGRSRR